MPNLASTNDALEVKHKSLKRIEGHNHARALNFSCFHNQPFLCSERACGWMIDAVQRARAKHGFHLWAYCLTPTHAHLLLYYPAHSGARVSAILASIKRIVTLNAIKWASSNNQRLLERMADAQPNGRAHLRFWQRGGGYDRNLYSAKHIWNMIDYIHHNPIEAGLCRAPTDWRWSSVASYAKRSPGPLNIDREHIPPDPR